MRGSSVLLPQTERAFLLRRFAPVLVLAALTGACSSGPAPATYDLSAPSSRIRGAAGVQVLVNEPAALQPLVDAADPGQGCQRLGLVHLGGGQWADNLPRLIQTRLINTFENSSQLRGVSRPSSGAVADVQLISELRRFEIATPDNAAVAEISVKIVSDRDGRIVNGRIFRAAVPASAVDAPNAARALDEALSVVMLDIVRWVSGSHLPRREDPGTAAAGEDRAPA